MFPYTPFTTFRFPIVFNINSNQQSCPQIIPNGIIPINFPFQYQNLQLNSSKQTTNVANVKPDEGIKI